MQTNLLSQVEHPSTFVLPCSSRLTAGSVLRVELPKGIAGKASHCEIMIDQGRAMDNARIRKRLGGLSRVHVAEVQGKLRQLLEL